LEAIGFVEDPVSTSDHQEKTFNMIVYPTISNDQFSISLETKESSHDWTVMVVDALGRKVSYKVEINYGEKIQFSISDVHSSGLNWIVLQKDNIIVDTRQVWVYP
jgi:hypothetical protein